MLFFAGAGCKLEIMTALAETRGILLRGKTQHKYIFLQDFDRIHGQRPLGLSRCNLISKGDSPSFLPGLRLGVEDSNLGLRIQSPLSYH
jgi:hypothetical protein